MPIKRGQVVVDMDGSGDIRVGASGSILGIREGSSAPIGIYCSNDPPVVDCDILLKFTKSESVDVLIELLEGIKEHLKFTSAVEKYSCEEKHKFLDDFLLGRIDVIQFLATIDSWNAIMELKPKWEPGQMGSDSFYIITEEEKFLVKKGDYVSKNKHTGEFTVYPQKEYPVPNPARER